MYKPFVKVLSRLAEKIEAYHLKDLATDKLKMLASKDSQGNTYDWKIITAN
jgi:hypothetical protein